MAKARKSRRKKKSVPRSAARTTTEDRGLERQKQPADAFPIVGVGASAGGLEAFTQFLESLPLDTGMGFVLVQHLDPDHESQLTQILSRTTSLPVREITNDERVEPNHVYVIPRDSYLTLSGGFLKIQPRPRTRAAHRPIDAFFESLARDRGERALGVVLSGTASDGTLGLEAIKAEGGITFAQDESAKYDSMPRSAIASGCVDRVLAPAQIAAELARIAKHPYVVGQPLTVSEEGDPSPLPADGKGASRTGARKVRAEAKAGEPQNAPGKGEQNHYRKILTLLRNHSGVDFSLYKSTGVQRRIARRVVLSKQSSLEEYADFLRGNDKELDSLFSGVLIGVTSFFRNPEAFDALEEKVLPELLERRGTDPLRCWVLGCSTGQEAYSLAIAFSEAVENAPRQRTIQIFATDLNESLLERARQGLYSTQLAESISPERLRRFFVEEEGAYRVTKTLRDMVVFARHNLITDPPFSRMDLISCRNLLIYLEPSLQNKALPTFHYALRSGGYLLLGASESVGGFTDLFEPVDKKHKIYCKKPAAVPAAHLPLRKEHGAVPRVGALPIPRLGRDLPEALHSELEAQREADRVTLRQFAPPGVLVDADLQVVQFRGATGAYLEPPIGKANFDVLKMAREGMRLPLRSAIDEARKTNRATRKTKVRIKHDGTSRTVSLDVLPLGNLRERAFLILFEEPEKTQGSPAPEPKTARGGVPRGAQACRIAELESELAEMREYFQTMQEQYEASHEEVQSANEEVQSANEELQSVNEELETSKEELESANEELSTVNDEMSNRNVDLNRLNDDLINFQSSTKLATILLGRDLTIRRFSPQAEKQLDLLSTDVSRPLSHIRHGLFEVVAVPPTTDGQTRAATRRPTPIDLDAMVAEVIAEVREQEREVLDRSGRWFSLRVRPYMTTDAKVDGAVLLLVDIDALKRSEQAIAAARDEADDTFETVREPLLVLDPELRVLKANRAFYRDFRVGMHETVGRPVFELGDGQWDIPRLRELLEQMIPENRSVPDFAVEHDFPSLGLRTMLINARRTAVAEPAHQRVLVAIEDITERVRNERAVRESEEHYRTLVEQVREYAVFRTNREGRATTWSEGVRRVLGFERDEFIGKDITKTIFTPEDVANGVPERELATAAATRTAESSRWMRRKNGEVFFAAGTTTALTNDAGEFSGFAKVMRDQTEAMLAEEASARLAAIVTSSDDAIISKDLRSIIRTWNRGAERNFGYSPEEVIGRSIELLIPDDRLHEERQILERIGRGELVEHFETVRRRKDGSLIDVALTISPIRDAHGAVVGAAQIARDITQRKRADAALRRSHAEALEAQRATDKLNEELRANAKRLREYGSELAKAGERKNEFLAMLGHELRNPLTALAFGLDLLGRVSDDDPRRSELREMMLRQTTRMATLLDQLLDIARLTSGKVELSKVRIDLADVVRAAIETVGPLVDAKQHEIELALPPNGSALVIGDAVRLTQVVENLLTNAAKYTDEGGRIEIALETDADKARIRVRDSGSGMSPELLPHVFEVFTQAPRTLDRAMGGLGLGLPLVRRMVEMHDGEVSASSPGLGLGSEFVVTLPRAAAPRWHTTAGPERKHDGPDEIASRRILVVDDEKDTADTLASLLSAHGHRTLAVTDGRAALEAIGTFDPEIVLLDLGLPGMNGYEVASKLREDYGDRRILLIALTGYQPDPARLEQAGFDHHLLKPADVSKLTQLLASRDGAPNG